MYDVVQKDFQKSQEMKEAQNIKILKQLPLFHSPNADADEENE